MFGDGVTPEQTDVVGNTYNEIMRARNGYNGTLTENRAEGLSNWEKAGESGTECNLTLIP
jgi:hypothetical protein